MQGQCTRQRRSNQPCGDLLLSLCISAGLKETRGSLELAKSGKIQISGGETNERQSWRTDSLTLAILREGF